MMNFEQVKGLIERAVYFVIMFAVARNWIPKEIAADLVILVVGILGMVWAFYINTKTSLSQAAAAQPGVVVVAPPEVKAASPNSPDIKSSAEVSVVKKAA